METRGRKQKVVKTIAPDGCPSGWEKLFLKRYKPACQGTCVPYLDKYDNKWKIVLFDTLEPQYIIYEFENKSYNRVIYDDSIQK
jgi:hypothetical protein